MDPTWEKVRVLGSGRATTVWEGHDRRLDRPVAIKELHDNLAGRGGFVDSYLAEARRMATISDPRVLTVHAVDDSADPPRLIVERADGTARDLADRGPLQPEQAERLLDHALQGLAAIHRHGIVHRGLKPENLFLCGDGYKVGDFGIGHSPDTPTLLLSSPRYTAPEQLAGTAPSGPDPRTDLYSLGLVLYELLLGTRAFEAAVDDCVGGDGLGGGGGDGNAPTDLDRWLRFHREAPDLPAPHRLDPSIPEPLSQVVARLAAKDPEARYQGAEDALRDLRARRSAPDQDTRSAPPPVGAGGDPTMTLGAFEAQESGRRRRRTLWIVATVVVLALAALVAFVVVRSRGVAVIDVTSEPPGAEILFEGEPVGTTPEEDLTLRIGTELTLRKEGFEETVLRLEDERSEVLHADLVPSEPDEPEEEEEEEPTEPPPLSADTRASLVGGLRALTGPSDGPTIRYAGADPGAIRFGDPLTFDVETDRDGTLVLFTISADGTAHVLYPGPDEATYPVGAWERLTLPSRADRADGFDLVAAEPAGPETVFVLTLGSDAPDAAPPDIPSSTAGRWLTSYRFDGPDSPAAELARWIAGLRREHPDATGLAALELRIVPREDTP